MKNMRYELYSDEYFMLEALKEAELAFKKDEVPVGAVVVVNNRIIARGHNMTEELSDVTAHAEMLALTAASNFLGSKYLVDCTLFVSLEPCLMCASALNWARLGRLVFGAIDEKAGYSLSGGRVLHPKTAVKRNVLASESSELLQSFFRGKR